MKKEAVILQKSGFPEWVNELREKYCVSGPVKGKQEYEFREIDEDNEISFDYTRTMIPPKKFFHPQKEELISYKRNDGIDSKLPEIEKKNVILGVHPCDARAIMVYDVVFGGDLPDPYYWNRRKNAVIIALTCLYPDKNCFCISWDENGPTMDDKGYDLLMTDLGEKYLIEIGSLEGSLLVQSDLFKKASPEDFIKKAEIVEETKKKIEDRIPDAVHLPEFLDKHYDHPRWKPEIDNCVSCGGCTLTCPTCFCYHVEDFNKWNTVDGKRVRMWDSCQLADFAEVAMNENFRKDRGARLKWRIYHKLAHWPEQFGTYGCTGCGRCMAYCIADIDMTRIIADIKKGENDA